MGNGVRGSAEFEGWPRRVHLLGAGGAGVSGIGRILAGRGVEVSGHDRADSQLLREFARRVPAIEVGPSAASSLPADAELVIRSAAVPVRDPQVVEATERGIPVLKYSEALPHLAAPANQLAVAGTHGKTSTSWMLWHALEGIAEGTGAPVAGALIGGLSQNLGTNALAASETAWFCLEACEYDRTFLRLSPFGAIITNVEEEHLDCYGTMDAVHRAFACFLDEVSSAGLIVLGRDVPEEVELGGRDTEIWRLGREFDVDLLGEERGRFSFRLRGPGWATRAITLQVPGHFNVENAALALALAIGLGARRSGKGPAELCDAAASGIERFEGVARRFESWGRAGGVEVVHDYAHHPTEVRVTIEAARRTFPRRSLHVLFQPHQYSRTARFLHEFADSLRAADRVVVADVYGARAHVDGEFVAEAGDLVRELLKIGIPAEEGGALDAAVRRTVEALPARSALLVLGAGDVDNIREALHEELDHRLIEQRINPG